MAWEWVARCTEAALAAAWRRPPGDRVGSPRAGAGAGVPDVPDAPQGAARAAPDRGVAPALRQGVPFAMGPGSEVAVRGRTLHAGSRHPAARVRVRVLYKGRPHPWARPHWHWAPRAVAEAEALQGRVGDGRPN
jgi:hypothetical protein